MEIYRVEMVGLVEADSYTLKKFIGEMADSRMEIEAICIERVTKEEEPDPELEPAVAELVQAVSTLVKTELPKETEKESAA